MCTVSFIPLNNKGVILTSSRDEKIIRPTSPPIALNIAGNNVFFPKDLEKGGTWIASADNGRVCCLLNGAWEKHKRKLFYEKSRGILLLEVFEHKQTDDFIQLVKLENVEPFTLIIIENWENSLKMIEFRWDGSKKYFNTKDISQPHIWSSATLYDKKVRAQREQWFSAWLSEQKEYSRLDVLNFHTSKHGENPAHDIVMERPGGLQTVSVTQVTFADESFEMHYHDLVKNHNSSFSIGIKSFIHE
ncbi:MAG: NRDE family protein [Bacteroidia bacterium]